MSFDLGVWHSEASVSSDEASRIYASFCRQEKPKKAVTSSPSLEDFYQALQSSFPDALSGKAGDSRQALTIHHANDHVLISCEWSQAEEVFALVQHLAEDHGLVLFDPQSEEVYLPDHIH